MSPCSGNGLRASMGSFRRADLLKRTALAGGELAPETRTAVREARVRRILLLRDFFCHEATQTGERCAADYFSDPEIWERTRPVPGLRLGDWLDDLAVQVEPRLGPGPPPESRIPEEAWPQSGLLSAIGSVYGAFLAALPDSRSAWFSSWSGRPESR